MSRSRGIDHASVPTIIDHTILGHKATRLVVEEKAQEAVAYDFASLCIPPTFVSLAKNILQDSSVKVCTVIGFPTGAHKVSVKAHEAIKALEDGASELDVVVNIGQLLSGNYSLVKEEIVELTQLIQDRKGLVKWIFETSEIKESHILSLCDYCMEANADFVKTSTGFASGGAKKEIVSLMRKKLEGKLRIKASGGIRTLEQLQDFYSLGADRIGTSSGVSIMKEIK